ncbi:glycosyltransferase family 4 protein [Aquamicrobium ahrensii]|uniref:Glycosyltransferase involved in cell wall biosynthesis n=1 Tax=Aquamicrobium ahrensii TaxID=469551 RepID=A0ABV2KH10_9HYPH
MDEGGKSRTVYVNGRFLRGPITGTSRVAEEVLACWDAAMLAGDARFSGMSIEVLCPGNAARALPLKAIPIRRRNILGGKFWEPVDLGLMAWKGTLVNFANVAPLYHPRAVTYLHDAQMFLYPQSYPAGELRTHRPLMRLAGRMSRRVVTVSDFSSRMLQRFAIAPASKIAVIHNGADHILRVAPDNSVLARFGLQPHGYVLMLGSAFPYKNVDVIYRAFARMGVSSLKLAVIARADLRKAVGSVQEVGDRLVVVSDVSDADLRALYQHALVFVQPARTEGFAMTQLEALNSGSPVITCALGSMPEVLGGDVVYADADSPDEWAQAILHFERDPRFRSQMVARGQAMAARYTWAGTADALWREVSDVAKGR